MDLLRGSAVGSTGTQSDDRELPHHAVVLMLKDVAVVHERHLGWRRIVEAHQNLGLLFDEHDILPAGLMRSRPPAVLAQDPEACTVHMEGVGHRHAAGADLPDLGGAELGCHVYTVHGEGAA